MPPPTTTTSYVRREVVLDLSNQNDVLMDSPNLNTSQSPYTDTAASNNAYNCNRHPSNTTDARQSSQIQFFTNIESTNCSDSLSTNGKLHPSRRPLSASTMLAAKAGRPSLCREALLPKKSIGNSLYAPCRRASSPSSTHDPCHASSARRIRNAHAHELMIQIFKYKCIHRAVFA